MFANDNRLEEYAWWGSVERTLERRLYPKCNPLNKIVLQTANTQYCLPKSNSSAFAVFNMHIMALYIRVTVCHDRPSRAISTANNQVIGFRKCDLSIIYITLTSRDHFVIRMEQKCSFLPELVIFTHLCAKEGTVIWIRVWECNNDRQSYTSFVKSVNLVAHSLLREDSPCNLDHQTEPPQSYPGNEA